MKRLSGIRRKLRARLGPVPRDARTLRQRAIMLLVLALLLTLAVELGNRGLSPARLFRFVTGSPVIFLCNWMIVLTSLVFSELFYRRQAVLGTVSLLWLTLGFVQFTVVKNRTTPFSSMDLLLLREAFSLITIYCTWAQIVGMFLGAFLVFALVILMFTRSPRREKRSLPKALVAFVGCALLCGMVAAVGVSTELLPRRFDSLVEAYDGYGFPVVFTYTFGRMGIPRPSDYSDRAVGEILEDIDTGDEQEVHRAFGAGDDLTRPNIVFLQLESFIDVDTIEGCELSRDPMPTFHRLRRNYPGGLLYVPTIGGGTVNTEFEIITGLNLDSFGAGESPYSTILRESTCETMAYNLRDYGYASTALHNNGATFYNRNEVFAMLGFDCFVPVEYMQNVHYNAMGWALDDVLTDEIMTAMRGTDQRDLVFCVSVATHGKYADTYEYQDGDIKVLNYPEGLPLAPFQNYVNALPGTDAFLKELIAALTRFDEPTVVVAYGDHLPSLELTDEALSTGSIYATEYVIWNNFDHDFQAPDVEAYRLNAWVLQQLGFSGGVITRLHQSVPPDDQNEEYLSRLELLEYDVFYGEQQAFEGESPYVATDMRLGSRRIAVTGAELDFHRLLVTGENFTEYSRIVLNGQLLDTLFVDSKHLIAGVRQSDAPIGSVSQGVTVEEVAVAQVNSDGVELGRTAPFRP